MAKHTKITKPAPPRKKSLDIESLPYFVPAAFVVILIGLVILFREFIFSNQMLYGSDMIQAGVYFRSFLIDYFAEHGSVPQWNPYIFGGMPYVDAFHGDIFYPLSMLKYIWPIFRILGLNLFFHIFLAGVFMYFAARQFNLSKIASILAAVCYTFAPYIVSFVSPGHDGKLFVTALFPLLILFLDRGFESRTLIKAILNFTLLGLTIGVVLLSPHPQMSYFALWAVAFYAAFKLIVKWRESKSVPALIRPATLAAYAVGIGLALSAIQYYPSYIYTTTFSPRAADDSKSGWGWATSWSLHEEEAFSLLIPEFSGTNAQTEGTYYWGKNAFKDNSESVGVVALFIALIGFFCYRRKESYFLGGLAIFALIYALGATTPIFQLFFYLIPKVQSLRAPSMIMFMFSYSVALLAGMGLQVIINKGPGLWKKSGKRFTYLIVGFPGLLLLLALAFGAGGRGMLTLWSSLFYSEASSIQVARGVTKLDVGMMNLPAIQSGAWWAFLFVAAAAACLWLYRSGKAGKGIFLALLLIPMIDGIRFNQRFIGTLDPSSIWAGNPIADFFNHTEGHYRVMNLANGEIRMQGPTVREDVLPYYGIEMVVGYHGNQLRWYDQLLGGPAKTNQLNPHLLNLVGAEYILFPKEQNFPDGYFGEKPLTPVADFGSIKILKNDNALPRVFLLDDFKVVADRADIYPEILAGTVDHRNLVYLEEEPTLTLADDPLGSDSAWVADYQIESVAVGVNCDDNKILVLADNYYDAWHVSVDDQPAKLLRSYGMFRAVEIPAGSKDVKFWYESQRYKTGRLITNVTGLWIIGVLAVCLVLGRKTKQPEPAE